MEAHALRRIRTSAAASGTFDPLTMSTDLRLVTWNIHKGIGTDGKYELARIVKVLKELSADVVCLQEVDDGCRRSGCDRQSHRLADALGYPHVALGLNVQVKEGAYGNLTLSRHPIDHVHNLDLTVPMKKRRGGLVTRIRWGHPKGWVVANVHLGLMHLERKVQVKRLLGHVIDDANRDQPLVIAGDWNEWGTRIVRDVTSRWGFHLARTDPSCKPHRTFPSRRPFVALDKVLYRDPIRLRHVACVVDDTTRIASDHLPLVVDLHAPNGQAT
jgi:endonuclease/exonuclease/phosphatase family metal-dependent hydrolase